MQQEKINKEIVERVRIEADSPWFAGHFPGNPILPGIAQLHMIARLIMRSQDGAFALARLSRVKFKNIVRPGEYLDIRVTAGNKDNLYSFTITRDEKEVCSGMLLLKPLQHLQSDKNEQQRNRL